MAITTDYQGHLRTLTFGEGTDYELTRRMITGLAVRQPTGARVSRGQGHGTAGGTDRIPSRLISIPLEVFEADDATAGAKLADINEAFAPADTDITLQLRIPGSPETVMYYFGRPSGVVEDQSQLVFGVIDVLARFDALDPLAYGAETTDLNNTGSFTVTNDGTAPTDRCTITVTSDGVGPMTLQNTDSIGSRTIEWSSTLSNGTVRVIDLRTGLVTTSGGSDRTSELNNTTSRLWPLVAGDNDIVATNMSDVDLTFRPAWY